MLPVTYPMTYKSAECSFKTHASQIEVKISPAVLTVVAVSSRVRRHGAVTSEVLPLLDTHTHVGTRVLLAGRTWACEKAAGKDGGEKMEREMPQEGHSQATIRATAEP